MRKILLVLLCIFCLNACTAEYIKPMFFYRSPFDPSMVTDVESYMRKASKNWNFELFEKDKKEMKAVTDGQEAFYLAFYHKDKAILDISNVGVGVVLTLALFDHGDMPIAELERLANEVRSGLKSKFGIQLIAEEP